MAFQLGDMTLKHGGRTLRYDATAFDLKGQVRGNAIIPKGHYVKLKGCPVVFNRLILIYKEIPSNRKSNRSLGPFKAAYDSGKDQKHRV